MRVFVALPISIEISKRIYNDFSFLSPYSKLIPPENMHITLNFFEDVKDTSFIKEKMENLDITTFDLRLKGVGAFPSFNFIRVLYVKVLLSAPIFMKLREFSSSIGEPFSTLHLTFARVKKRINLTTLPLNKDYGTQTISKIILYQSILSRPNPIYKIIYSKELLPQ